MPKKVLICEDDRLIAENLFDKLQRRGYEPSIILVEEGGCMKSCIEGRVENTALREQSDCMIVDGLNGQYDCAAEAARGAKPGITPIIFAANEDLIRGQLEKKDMLLFKSLIQQGCLSLLKEICKRRRGRS